ncbi:hypothetical protein GCM10010387_21790 [Streptomyces inusitatus]|uniref:Uncharacterized protein n=1 Tax=Streptomyces inusitatus TaxID=68221 RepID=A0A918UQV3_9ACTN|nr:hypothetical protein [Streptomyces inusitatus]GGZ28029.1 hypothetical protein GCM10010387_21790 [Streptomyces inusitatus]
MLTTVAMHWIWLMAAAATVIHCFAMAKWIPLPVVRTAYPLVIVGCGVLVIALGDGRELTSVEKLVLYPSSLIGLTVGLLPSRKLFTVWALELKEGVRRERFEYPRWHVPFAVGTTVVFIVLGFALTR